MDFFEQEPRGLVHAAHVNEARKDHPVLGPSLCDMVRSPRCHRDRPWVLPSPTTVLFALYSGVINHVNHRRRVGGKEPWFHLITCISTARARARSTQATPDLNQLLQRF
jgi:hypothetical protein